MKRLRRAPPSLSYFPRVGAESSAEVPSTPRFLPSPQKNSAAVYWASRRSWTGDDRELRSNQKVLKTVNVSSPANMSRSQCGTGRSFEAGWRLPFLEISLSGSQLHFSGGIFQIYFCRCRASSRLPRPLSFGYSKVRIFRS